MDTQFWSIVGLTITVSGTAVLASTLIGIPIGLAVGMSTSVWKNLIRVVVHTGMALPPVVVGLLLYILLSRSGPLSGLGWLFTVQAMMIAQFVLALPFVVGCTMSAVESLPPDLVLQLRSLGATNWQVKQALLNECRSGIVVAVAAALGRSISEVGAVMLVGGNIAAHTRVLTTAIVLETSKGNFHFALQLGAALVTLALVLNLIVVTWSWSRRP